MINERFKILVTTVLAGSAVGPSGISVSTSLHTLVVSFDCKVAAEKAFAIINAANRPEALDHFNRTAIKLFE